MDDNSKPAEDGFEYDGTFYRWSVSDGGKDLMLIDRFARMPITEFFELIEDSFDRGRAPLLLSLIATSVRATHPDWTVERIERLVLDLNLSEVVFIDADVEASDLPPVSTGGEEPISVSPSDVLSSTSSETVPDLSETFSGIPV